MGNIKVLAFSGSLRKESYNRKVLQEAKKFALEAGADVEEIDLKELNLPVYDEDIEDFGFPEQVVKFREAIQGADMIMIACPEYNHSVPGGLKNAIDWASTGDVNVLEKKVAAIFGASTGLFGTVRAQAHLRQILTALEVRMVPQPNIYIRSAKEAFGPDGLLKDQKTLAQLKKLVVRSLELTTIFKKATDVKNI
jgi:chromate reductase, NAD(P)H dehydrogenase (quinone)